MLYFIIAIKKHLGKQLATIANEVGDVAWSFCLKKKPRDLSEAGLWVGILYQL